MNFKVIVVDKNYWNLQIIGLCREIVSSTKTELN